MWIQCLFSFLCVRFTPGYMVTLVCRTWNTLVDFSSMFLYLYITYSYLYITNGYLYITLAICILIIVKLFHINVIIWIMFWNNVNANFNKLLSAFSKAAGDVLGEQPNIIFKLIVSRHNVCNTSKNRPTSSIPA